MTFTPANNYFGPDSFTLRPRSIPPATSAPGNGDGDGGRPSRPDAGRRGRRPHGRASGCGPALLQDADLELPAADGIAAPEKRSPSPSAARTLNMGVDRAGQRLGQPATGAAAAAGRDEAVGR